MYLAILLIIYIVFREWFIYYRIEDLKTQIIFHSKETYKQRELMNQMESSFHLKIKTAREDALKRAKHVMRGQATEHLAPLMISDWNHKDYRFIGSPVDYFICAGASDILDGQAEEIKEIIILDIKTGKATLTKVQRAIRNAIIANKIKFATYNPDTKELKISQNKEQ